MSGHSAREPAPLYPGRRMSQEHTLRAVALALAADVPVLLWGLPGTGKSSVLRDIATGFGWQCEVVVASIREPADFAGLPIVDGQSVRFAPPRWAERLATAGEGLLFLDELSTAAPAVQAALLRVVLERSVGDIELPSGVRIVAAANPPEQTADGWDLAAPLANRFCHLDWTVGQAEFERGFAAGWPRLKFAGLPPDWERWTVRARHMVSAFSRVRPSLVAQIPNDGSRASRGWPSPRSWEMTARLLGAAEAVGADQATKMLLVAGSVGQGAGVEFLTWLTELDLEDPEAALADPSSLVLPERGDRALAVLMSVVAAVAANPTAERWRAAWKVLATAANGQADIGAVAARYLARYRPDGVEAPAEVELFEPVLRAAELM